VPVTTKLQMVDFLSALVEATALTQKTSAKKANVTSRPRHVPPSPAHIRKKHGLGSRGQ